MEGQLPRRTAEGFREARAGHMGAGRFGDDGEGMDDGYGMVKTEKQGEGDDGVHHIFGSAQNTE